MRRRASIPALGESNGGGTGLGPHHRRIETPRSYEMAAQMSVDWPTNEIASVAPVFQSTV